VSSIKLAVKDRSTWSVGVAALFGLGELLDAPCAQAQLRWDAGAGVGAIARLTSTSGDLRAEPGIFGQVLAHVALAPMLRAGFGLAHDISQVSGGPARQTTEAALRVKVSLPLLGPPWRAWAFAGAGAVRSYWPSHAAQASPWSPIAQAVMPGVEGWSLDLPLGVGIGLRARDPWMLFAELAGRITLVSTGSMYDSPPCCGQPFVGSDSGALSLVLGASIQE
jgi:hypothetical protein